MAQISPSAPASGPIRTMAPNSTDCTPPLIVYFLVQLDRADDLEDAMHYCQSTDEQHRRIAPGHRKVMAPAACAREETATSRQVRPAARSGGEEPASPALVQAGGMQDTKRNRGGAGRIGC